MILRILIFFIHFLSCQMGNVWRAGWGKDIAGQSVAEVVGGHWQIMCEDKCIKFVK